MTRKTTSRFSTSRDGATWGFNKEPYVGIVIFELEKQGVEGDTGKASIVKTFISSTPTQKMKLDNLLKRGRGAKFPRKTRHAQIKLMKRESPSAASSMLRQLCMGT